MNGKMIQQKFTVQVNKNIVSFRHFLRNVLCQCSDNTVQSWCILTVLYVLRSIGNFNFTLHSFNPILNLTNRTCDTRLSFTMFYVSKGASYFIPSIKCPQVWTIPLDCWYTYNRIFYRTITRLFHIRHTKYWNYRINLDK